MSNPYTYSGRGEGFLEDNSNLAAAGSAFQGFVEGWQKASDNQMKRQEHDAQLEALKTKMQREADQTRIEEAKAGYTRDLQNKLVRDPARLKEAALLKLAPSGLVPEFDENQNISGTHYSPEYMDVLRAKSEMDPFGLKGMAATKAKTEAIQAQKGFKLPPDKVLQVQQGAQIPNQLRDIGVSLANNKKLLGPLQGRAGGANPYDESSQTLDAQLRAASQNFGRYMEGGVLRKEDEEKYRKMFPQLSDTPEVAKNKLAIVNKLLADKHNADITALRAQGYDVSGFGQISPGELPSSLTGKKKGLVKKGGLVNKGLIGGGEAPKKEKPKTVEQDGVTYTLNPQTGEYE